MLTETIADELVRLVSEKCFHGVLPPHPDIICEAVVKCMPGVADADEEVQKQFANELLLALCERIHAQAIAEETEFQN